MSDQRTFSSMAWKPAVNHLGLYLRRGGGLLEEKRLCFGREQLWTPPSRHRLDEEPTETRDPEMRQTRGIVHIHTVTGGCQAEWTIACPRPAPQQPRRWDASAARCATRSKLRAASVRSMGSPYLAPCQPGVRAAHPAER